jgi:lambda family phage portal protein
VLEADYLYHLNPFIFQPPVGGGGPRIVGGVELNDWGAPVAYHLFPHHPGDPIGMAGFPYVTRVPVDELIHLFVEERPEQAHGTPVLTTVLIRLRDLDEYADAQVVRQKIAACFATFYTEPEGMPPTTAAPLLERVEPGMIERVPPGMEVTFGNPPGVQNYDEFMTRELQGIGAGTGVPYEDLTGDYSKVNFSSARMGRAAFHALVDELQWLCIVPQFLNRVWEWWREAAALAGVPTDGVDVQWTMPRKTLVDPAREVPATIRGVRAGLTSPQEAMRELGYDPDTVLDEWKAFTKMVDDLGLVFDIDPRRTTQAGGVPNPRSPEPEPGAIKVGGEIAEPPAPTKGGVPTRVNGTPAA